jgi:predicted porin
MNKKLIALAVAGACVAPAAMAQTANPVTLYGILAVTVESVEAKGGATPISRRTRIEDQASRLGVRGTEDLGAGLKAFFQLETAFRPDSNNTTFAARNSGVGLQGGWGSILIGRWDMPFKVATGVIDQFGDVTIGGFNATLQSTRTAPATFDRREENVFQYWSPSWGGFAFRGAISANEAKGCTTAGTPAVTTCLDPQDWGASATWTRGPMYLFYAYEEHKDVSATISKEDANAMGGTFAFGAIKIGGQYQEIKVRGAVSRSTIKNWMANLGWTLGNNVIYLVYMNSKDGGLNAAPTQPDCDNMSIGWQYNFTRRTFMLAQYTKIDNNEAGNCNFGSQRLAISNGQDPQGISIGLRHAF